ncbi:unnamed protein product [Rhizoctonia solani]|uniref:Uncharacterized protein n=1 Tax=Rhizoctonia solani TaxID=456999 RepID=A0A8H3CFV9_9AGAM|nr:unnamed protein product [Rhizoctonia solani]
MTLWTFDLHSNDSDIEDDEENCAQSTRQEQVNKELEGLFGCAEDERIVEYKPNPWSIAKINANTRNSALPTKSRTNKTRKPAGDSGSKSSGLEQLWENSKGALKGGRAVSLEANAPNAKKSLRDSISEALRRGGPVATLRDPNAPAQGQNNATEKPTDPLESQLIGRAGHSTPLWQANLAQRSGITLPLDFRHPPDNPTQSLRDSHEETMFQGYIPHEFGAYIPRELSTMPVFNEASSVTGDCGQLDASDESSASDTHSFNKFAPSRDSKDSYTLGESSYLSPYGVRDGMVSSDGFIHKVTSPHPDLRWERTLNERTPDHFRTGSPELGPGWITQSQISLASPYSDIPRRTKFGPSPTVQLIARFAAPNPNGPIPASRYPEYSDPGAYQEESPIFAWSPPSPAPEQSQQYTQPYRRQVYPPHTPEHTSRPTPKKQLTTPPRKKATRGFDSYDTPFWSTLPTPPNSKLKLPVDGIKTTRFRLPGSFLGSSPLSGSSGRTLYKPPPRKRTRSKGDESSATKWKVVRMG